jgi:(1->4)-alpha-D-glucan 1-alpha-D-glucosylmutase
MLATATHDHKRGEDVRARLAVLSELPDRWAALAKRWIARAEATALAIDPGDAYALFQTLVGAWPMTLTPWDAEGLADFETRVAGWQEKALREAKLRSSWAAPNADYEAKARAFLHAALDPAGATGLALEIAAFAAEIASAGAANGLVQTLLRCTVPGVPDTYQGTEFWDLSLVDPDNRRAVDFASRRLALSAATPIDELAASWRDGRVKQQVLAMALDARRRHPAVFRDGDYLPLSVVGARTGHVLAFARRSGDACVVAAVALRCAPALIGRDALTPPADWWSDTAIQWPDAPEGLTLAARDLFAVLPVALLGAG